MCMALPMSTATCAGDEKCGLSVYGKILAPAHCRTVWATEWLRDGGDFHTAAIMLNDRLETVIATYSHLLEEDVAEKAYAHIDKRNGSGT